MILQPHTPSTFRGMGFHFLVVKTDTDQLISYFCWTVFNTDKEKVGSVLWVRQRNYIWRGRALLKVTFLFWCQVGCWWVVKLQEGTEFTGRYARCCVSPQTNDYLSLRFSRFYICLYFSRFFPQWCWCDSLASSMPLCVWHEEQAKQHLALSQYLP